MVFALRDGRTRLWRDGPNDAEDPDRSVARCGGRRVAWPEQHHADRGQQYGGDQQQKREPPSAGQVRSWSATGGVAVVGVPLRDHVIGLRQTSIEVTANHGRTDRQPIERG